MAKITASGPNPIPTLKKILEQTRSEAADSSEQLINKIEELLEAINNITD